MNWDALQLFLKLAGHGSMSAAAGELKLSVATIARRIEALEQSLGARLVVRTPRGLQLTETGEALRRQAEPCKTMMAELERTVRGFQSAAVDPIVRISATEPVIAEILAPAVTTFLWQNQSCRVALEVENAVVSLSLNDADIAVRLVRPQGDSLVGKRVKPLAMGLYCARGKHVEYTCGEDLCLAPGAPVISYDDSYGPIPELRWLAAAGLERCVRVTTSSTRAMLNAVAAGAGAAILPRIFAERRTDLAEINLGGSANIPDRHAWIVWHRSNTRNPTIRRTIRWIEDAFAAAAHPSRPSAGNVSSNQ